MKIPIVGGAYTAKSTNLNAQKCINWYPVVDKEGAKEPTALYPTPGLKTWKDTGSGTEIRGMIVMGDYVYVTSGTSVYRIDANQQSTTMTGNLLTVSGRVWMATNGTYVMITDGTYGYYVSGTTLTRITDADFVNGGVPSSLTHQDGYFIASKGSSDYFYISPINDPSGNWDSTDEGSAQGQAGDIQGILSDHRELVINKTDSTEIFYNSGDADFPFERTTGAFIERGSIAPFSIAKGDNAVFWLADDKTVRRLTGYQASIVSTRQIEYVISTFSKVDDAIGYVYSQEGNTFYVLTFPTAAKTYVYNMATSQWHQWSSWPLLDTGEHNRHRANCHAFFQEKNLVGDHSNGIIYELSATTYKDYQSEIIRVRACQNVHKDRLKVAFNRLEVDLEGGVGLAVDDSDISEGEDPLMMLRWSDDGGHTWSSHITSSIGKIGKYEARAIWRRLGSGRERIFELSISDPVKAVIIGAELKAKVGNS